MNANKRIVEANSAGTNEQTGAYQRLSQEYTALAQKAQDMAVVYGVNSEETVKAAQEAKALSDRLKEIDASVGQNQRNVGNYSGSIEASAKSILGMKQKLEMLIRLFRKRRTTRRSLKALPAKQRLKLQRLTLPRIQKSSVHSLQKESLCL